MRARTCLAFLCLAIFSARAPGADETVDVSITAAGGNAVLLVYRGASDVYGKGDGVCLYRAGKAVACGHVLSSEDTGFRLKLVRGGTRFRRGELLRAKTNAKFTNAETTEHALDVTVGARLYGPSGVYPAYFGKVHLVVSRKIAIGAEVFFSSSDSGNLTTVGGYLFGTYYFTAMFRGLYAVGAVGAYSISAKAVDATSGLTLSETALSPSVRAGAGHRWIFGTVFNFAVEGGAQVLTKTSGEQLNFGYSAGSLYAGIEFGWMF